MKSINGKDIGKTDEEILIDHINKALREAYKHYIGKFDELDIKKCSDKILDQLNNISNDDFKKKINKYNGISMGCYIKQEKCLICGSKCDH